VSLSVIIPNKNYNQQNLTYVIPDLILNLLGHSKSVLKLDRDPGPSSGWREWNDMIKVEFLGPIGKASIEMEAATLAEVAEKLKEDATVKEWLPKCAVALNDTMVSDLSTVLKEGDRVSILPPVCGG